MKILTFVILLLFLEGVSPLYSQELVVDSKQGQNPVGQRNPQNPRRSPQGSGRPPQNRERPCYKDGKSHPHNTRLGDQLCSNGEWISVPP